MQPAIEYYGLSTFSIEYNETTILVDPWFEPDWVHSEASDFTDVEYILVTHGAHDHLGSAFPIAERTGAQVITEPAVADHLIAGGLPPEQVTTVVWGNHIELEEFALRALETHHISYFESETGSVSGIALGFLIEIADTTVYYLGDTALFSDLKLFGDLYNPDIALVPIGNAPGAYAPLPPEEAALATEWLNVETVIPVHYTPESTDLETFQRAVGDKEVETTITQLEPGERLDT
jgi:L-ascorbate metabolism protein UlaG (beta-lactamase superfamily)